MRLEQGFLLVLTLSQIKCFHVRREMTGNQEGTGRLLHSLVNGNATKEAVMTRKVKALLRHIDARRGWRVRHHESGQTQGLQVGEAVRLSAILR